MFILQKPAMSSLTNPSLVSLHHHNFDICIFLIALKYVIPKKLLPIE